MNRHAIEAIADEYAVLARTLLEAHGALVPVALLLPPFQGRAELIPFIGAPDSDAMARVVAARARATGAVGAVLVHDGWSVSVGATAFAGRPSLRTYQGERPSDLPDRTEVVSVSRAGLGWCETAIFPFHRDGKKIVWSMDSDFGRWGAAEVSVLAYFTSRAN